MPNVVYEVVKTDGTELTEQLFDFQSLGIAAAVAAQLTLLREPARALDELQIMILLPVDDIRFTNQIQRADELHSGIVFAVNFRHHRLYL